jgi:glycosyltransferase involved in cell wall biosynthesis
MTEPRAVVVCPKFPYPPTSGGVKRALRLIECMQRAGLAVEIATDDTPPPRDIEALERQGVQSFVAGPEPSAGRRRLQQHALRLPGPRSHALAARLSGPARLVQFEGVIASTQLTPRTTAPIVFSTQNVEAEIAREATRQMSRLSREGQRRRYHARRVARAERRTSRRADVVLCVSTEDAAAFEPFSRQVVVAPNGVDDAFFTTPVLPPESEDVLFFGQFSYAPNHDGLMRFLREGWPRLSQARPSARVLIAGEGSDDLSISGLAAVERVVQLGLVEDIAATVADSRLVIVPIWSGGGTRLKVLESLAAARPVVGTALGVSGIGFRSGEHGLVAETPREIADAAAALLADPSRMDTIALRARELARPFAWSTALAPAEGIYRDYALRSSGDAD